MFGRHMRLMHPPRLSRLRVVLIAVVFGLVVTSTPAAPLRAKDSVTKIVFASGSDDTGTV